MGIPIFGKGCFTNQVDPNVKPPNPSNWKFLDLFQFTNAYVLVVRYDGCSNFEGIKILVFKGQYRHRDLLDPHFADNEESPIARFKPTDEGMALARMLASNL